MGRCEVNFGMTVNEIHTGQGSVNIKASITESGLQTNSESKRFEADFVINCAGIYADELAAKQGLQSPIRLLPFRGEYYRLSNRFDDVTKHLVYPIPDPNMPFLGVHLTRMVDGFTTVGPNAVLATGREQYTGISLSISEWARLGGYSGTWKLLWKFKQHALHEFANSLSKRFYLKQINKYCTHIKLDDLQPFRAGIRAQAVTPSGELLHDFSFLETPFSLHVLNAPSPAATSALPIADAIVDKILK
jgi:L-2-hydroxyglutarate oxidase